MSGEKLGDFEEYGDGPDASEDSTDDEAQPGSEITPSVSAEELDVNVRELEDKEAEVERIRPLDEENPLGLDPRVGVKDLAYDRAKPGAKVYVVACLGRDLDAYEESFPDSPALDEYAGNVLTRFSRDDAVYACVYVKDSLTSADSNTTAYPMPESRLTRFPAEEAAMVGSSSVEFHRTPVPGDDDTPTLTLHLDREESGGTRESSPSGEEMDLESALSALSAHGYPNVVEKIAAEENVDESEVYGL